MNEVESPRQPLYLNVAAPRSSGTPYDHTKQTSSWSEQEEQRLFELHDRLGNRWAKIAQMIEGRTDNCIKNHFYCTLRKSMRRVNKFISDNRAKVKSKEIKNIILSKIIAVAEEKFERKLQVPEQLIQKCCQIKNRLVKYSKDIELTPPLEDDLNDLVNEINDFNKAYKKKKSKKKLKNSGVSADGSASETESRAAEKVPKIQKKAQLKPIKKQDSRLDDKPKILRNRANMDRIRLEAPPLIQTTNLNREPQKPFERADPNSACSLLASGLDFIRPAEVNLFEDQKQGRGGRLMKDMEMFDISSPPRFCSPSVAEDFGSPPDCVSPLPVFGKQTGYGNNQLQNYCNCGSLVNPFDSLLEAMKSNGTGENRDGTEDQENRRQ